MENIKATDFQKIYQNAFPLSVENPYQKMTNYLYQIYMIMVNMRKNNQVTDLNVDHLQDASLAKNEINEIEQKIMTLMSKPNKNVEDWKLIEELVEQARVSELKRSSNEKKAASFMTTVEESASYQEMLKNSIDGLRSSLDSIASLDINNEKRIDGINVNNRHFEQISQMPEIDDKQKSTLMNLLDSYVRTKVKSYKRLEEFASIVLATYDKRELTEYTFDNEDQLWRAPTTAISSLTNSFNEDMNSLLAVGMPTIALEPVEMDIKVLEQYGLYLDTGDFDRDFIDGALKDSSIKNYSTTDAMVNLYNCKSVKLSEEESFGR